MRPGILVLSSFIFLSLLARAQDATIVIQKHITFIGGEKNWKGVKTITTSGEYDYGGIKFPFTAYAKAPNRYKFIVPFNGKYYAQAFDGIKGWKIDAFKNETLPTVLTGTDAIAMANEADVELENVFIRYKEKGHSATMEGKDSVLNRLCYKIKFVRKNGEVETYYFDNKTFELVMKQAVSKNTEMNGSILNTYFSDYRDLKGIKIAFKSASKINDQSVLTITIDKALFNEEIDDKEFLPQ